MYNRVKICIEIIGMVVDLFFGIIFCEFFVEIV